MGALAAAKKYVRKGSFGGRIKNNRHKQQKLPDLDFAGVPASHAEWAWRHEVARELAGDAAVFLVPTNQEFWLMQVHASEAGATSAPAPIFSSIVRGAEVGKAVPGCKQVTVSIAPGATRQDVAAVLQKWLVENLPQQTKPTGRRDKRNFVVWLRDLAVLRCLRAGLEGADAEDLITDALSSLVRSPRELNTLMRPVRKHYQMDGRLASAARERIEAERVLGVVAAEAEQERLEQEREQRKVDEDSLLAALAEAEAAGDKKTAAKVRAILGLT